MGRRKVDPARDAARSTFLQGIVDEPQQPSVTWVDHTQQRALVTIRADSQVWDIAAVHLTPEFWTGALIRLEPPAGAAPADIDGVKAGLLQVGAAAVRVMPKVAEQAAQAPAHDPAAPRPGGSLRERAQARVAALVGVRDRAALKAAVDEALTAAGI